jgi:hypothetical protein
MNISESTTTTKITIKKHPLHKKKLIIRPKVQTPQTQVALQTQVVEQTTQTTQTPVVLQTPVALVEAQPIPIPIPMQIEQYISQLNNQEKIVLKIATEHLKSSFDIEKSIGFKNWQKKK